MKTIKRHILLILTALMIFTTTTPTYASSQKQMTQKTSVYVKKSTKSKKVTKIAKGEIISMRKTSGKWAKIQFNGKTGWVKRKALKNLPKSSKMTTKASATIYRTLSGKKKAGTVPKGKTVKVLAKSGSHSYITYNSQKGWVCSSLLKKQGNKKNVKKKATKNNKKKSAINLTKPSGGKGYTGKHYSPYDIDDTYYMTELSSEGKAFVAAVWNAIKTGTQDKVDIGHWSLFGDDWLDAEIAMDENYFMFYGTPEFEKEEDEGDCISLTGEKGYRIIVDVKASRTALAKNEKKIQRCKKIAKGYINSGMSQKEKVNAIARAVCDYFTYDGNYKYKGFDTCLKKRRGVCDEYAKLFRAICIGYGIECRKIEGNVYGTGFHAWNQVKIGKTWYYIDPTWMDYGKNDYGLTRNLWSTHREEYYFKAND